MRILCSVIVWAFSLAAFAASAEPPLPSDSLLNEVGSACLKARKPKDLDDLASRLSIVQRGPSEGSQRADIQTASSFVSRWQQYLAALNSGNRKNARQVLQDLLNSQDWLIFLPRSEVIALAEENPSVSPPEVPCNSWTDLPSAIEILKKNPPDESAQDKPDDLGQLINLQKLSGDIVNKNWEAVVEGCTYVKTEGLCVRKFKQLLLAKVVVGYLKLEPKYQREPESNESAGDYLRVLETKARNQADWISLWRIMAFERENDYNKTPFQLLELKGIDLMFSAQKLERSGTPEKAAVRYRSALLLSLPPALVESIHQNIQEFQKTNPEAWAKGSAENTIAPSLTPGKDQSRIDSDDLPKNQNGRPSGLWFRY